MVRTETCQCGGFGANPQGIGTEKKTSRQSPEQFQFQHPSYIDKGSRKASKLPEVHHHKQLCFAGTTTVCTGKSCGFFSFFSTEDLDFPKNPQIQRIIAVS